MTCKAGPKSRSPDGPIDGRAVFDQAISLAGLGSGWQRVRENAGSAGGDGGITSEAFTLNAAERIAALWKERGASPHPFLIHAASSEGLRTARSFPMGTLLIFTRQTPKSR